MTKGRYIDGLCDCSCGDPCPFGKRGSETRCRIDDGLAFFACTIDELPGTVAAWREDENIRARARWDAMFGGKDIRIKIVQADRPE